MDQNYPRANLWTRVEVDIEAEPALVAIRPGLNLPAIWPDERRQAWLLGFDKPIAVS